MKGFGNIRIILAFSEQPIPEFPITDPNLSVTSHKGEKIFSQRLLDNLELE